MLNKNLSRRELLGGMLTVPLMPTLLQTRESDEQQAANFSYCLNTSTIMGQKLGLVREIEIAAHAGYDGVEIWIPTLHQYLEGGGSLKELDQRIRDLGIKVENAIGFANWIVDEHDVRMAGLEQAKKEMDLLAQIGCHRLAAPPAGATNRAGLDLDQAAERFRALCELGEEMTVAPQLEIWGFSKNLFRLSQILYVAAESGYAEIRILPDVYHLYKGGSDFDGLKLLNPKTVEIFHINDYPAEPNRAEIQDKDRVYPGLGIAPMNDILRSLNHPDHPTILSLELFNRDYWKRDPMEVAKTGLTKIKAAVEKAIE